MIVDAIEGYIETLKDHDEPIPVDTNSIVDLVTISIKDNSVAHA
jgi:predicted RNase H-like HicB family nuclease